MEDSKKKNNKTIEMINLVLMMIGSLVGVGFLSGAEIFEFFARFQKYSYLGILIFFVLMFILSYKILDSNNLNENALNMYNFNKKIHKNTSLLKFRLKSIIVNFNVLMIASAMFSGLYELTNKLFYHNGIFIFLTCVFIVFYILIKGIGCFSKVNFFIVILLIFVTFVLIKNLNNNYQTITNIKLDNSCNSITLSCLFPIVYIFMNIVEIQPVIKESGLKFNRKGKCVFSLCFSLILTTILFVFTLFLQNHMNLCNSAMPLLDFFKSEGGILYTIFTFGLLGGLISTLIACLIGVKRGFVRKNFSNTSASFVAVFLALLIGIINFKFFVKIIYPIIGILNFIVFVFL